MKVTMNVQVTNTSIAADGMVCMLLLGSEVEENI